jgi:hypothetical protein
LTEEEIIKLADDVINDFFKYITTILPKVIYFDDFCDLLPDTIYLSDLEQNRTDIK